MEEQYIWEMVSFACYYLKNSKTWTTSSYDKIVFASLHTSPWTIHNRHCW